VAVWRRRKEVGDVAALALEEVAGGRGVAGEPFGGSSEHAESTVGACACSQMSGEAARWACLQRPLPAVTAMRLSQAQFQLLTSAAGELRASES
jgi:hypothetical protein